MGPLGIETPRSERAEPREPPIAMYASFRVPVAWSQVMKRTVKDLLDDHCLGLAAQLAYYFLLALFPALLFFVVLIGYLPIENEVSALLAALATVAPRELLELLHGQLTQIAGRSSVSLLTLGVLHAGRGAGNNAVDRQFLRVQAVFDQLRPLHYHLRRHRRGDCHDVVVLRLERRH